MWGHIDTVTQLLLYSFRDGYGLFTHFRILSLCAVYYDPLIAATGRFSHDFFFPATIRESRAFFLSFSTACPEIFRKKGLDLLFPARTQVRERSSSIYICTYMYKCIA